MTRLSAASAATRAEQAAHSMHPLHRAGATGTPLPPPAKLGVENDGGSCLLTPGLEVVGTGLLVVGEEAREDIDQHAIVGDLQVGHALDHHAIKVHLGLRYGHAAVGRDLWHGYAAALGLREREDA